MAAVPQQEPAKPKSRERQRPKWLVYEYTPLGGDGPKSRLEFVGVYEARNADAANWQAAEGPMREKAMSDEPPMLAAIKATELEPRTYRLRSTVERVKA